MPYLMTNGVASRIFYQAEFTKQKGAAKVTAKDNPTIL
jgi:hypothetical protein